MSTSTPQPTHLDQDVRTVSFVSLGCPKNLVDSEKMLGQLAEDGITPVSWDPSAPDDYTEPADAVVVNTCGFLEASKQESLDVIGAALEQKEKGNVKRVIVAGCLVQRHRAKILDWAPGIDSMIGVFDRDHITKAVTGTTPKRKTLEEASDNPKYWIAGNALQAADARGMQTVGLTVQGKDGKGIGYFEKDDARLRLTPRHYAFLKISEGCNQRCAFCTIPSIRGKMRSKSQEDILIEARELLADGAFELNLIGQDTTSYGDDIGTGFARTSDGHAGGLPHLLTQLNDIVDREGQGHPVPGWIRLMYAYPTNFEDEMIDAIAALPNVCNYIDIPLQHASNKILTSMRRNVTAEHQTELMHKLRDRVPGIAIRTTFITGFPGETEEDHEKLLSFIEEVGFDAVGVFEYSKEPGTVAGTMEDDPELAVPADVKTRRKDEIMQLQQELAFEQARFIADAFDPNAPEDSGHQFDVLIDKPLGSTSMGIAGLNQSADSVESAGKSGGTGGGEASGGVETSTGGDRRAAAAAQGRLHQGRTYFQAVDVDALTYVQSREQLAPGELVRCTVVDADGYDLIARPTAELSKTVSLNIL